MRSWDVLYIVDAFSESFYTMEFTASMASDRFKFMFIVFCASVDNILPPVGMFVTIMQYVLYVPESPGARFCQSTVLLLFLRFFGGPLCHGPNKYPDQHYPHQKKGFIKGQWWLIIP